MATTTLTTGRINTPSVLTSATALVANQNRLGWTIQNVGTNPLFICLGGTASTSVFHYVLKGSTLANDGTGGLAGENVGSVYTGIITVAGTSPSYVVMEH